MGSHFVSSGPHAGVVAISTVASLALWEAKSSLPKPTAGTLNQLFLHHPLLPRLSFLFLQHNQDEQCPNRPVLNVHLYILTVGILDTVLHA